MSVTKLVKAVEVNIDFGIYFVIFKICPEAPKHKILFFSHQNTAILNTFDKTVIITPAQKTPKQITPKLFFLSRWRSEARSEPVQAPVPGNGMAK